MLKIWKMLCICIKYIKVSKGPVQFIVWDFPVLRVTNIVVIILKIMAH